MSKIKVTVWKCRLIVKLLLSFRKSTSLDLIKMYKLIGRWIAGCVHAQYNLKKNSPDRLLRRLAALGCVTFAIATFCEYELIHSRSLYYVIARPSVCRLPVTFVHPTQAIEICGNVSTPFGMFAICWHPGKILRSSSHGNPSVWGVKHWG